jgi:hypothetical protein
VQQPTIDVHETDDIASSVAAATSLRSIVCDYGAVQRIEMIKLILIAISVRSEFHKYHPRWPRRGDPGGCPCVEVAGGAKAGLQLIRSELKAECYGVFDHRTGCREGCCAG